MSFIDRDGGWDVREGGMLPEVVITAERPKHTIDDPIVLPEVFVTSCSSESGGYELSTSEYQNMFGHS